MLDQISQINIFFSPCFAGAHIDVIGGKFRCRRRNSLMKLLIDVQPSNACREANQ